jgi:trimethylamine corrinoid protein
MNGMKRNESMNLADLFGDARQSIIDANEDWAMELIQLASEAEVDLIELLQKGFSPGNMALGESFEKGEISLPELLYSAEVMKKVLSTIDQLLGVEESAAKGRVLIATVEGDVHEIGKGIVASTMKAYGLHVIDIGREVSVETIIEKAIEHQADIIATSALLTSTLKEQRKLEALLNKMALRGTFQTMVGGAPCTLRWAARIGADAYGEDAIEAARTALRLIAERYPDRK